MPEVMGPAEISWWVVLAPPREGPGPAGRLCRLAFPHWDVANGRGVAMTDDLWPWPADVASGVRRWAASTPRTEWTYECAFAATACLPPSAAWLPALLFLFAGTALGGEFPHGGPVIDMHLHAFPMDELPVGTPRCPGDRDVPAPTLDPRAAFDLASLATCQQPLRAARDDADLRVRSLAELRATACAAPLRHA